MHIKLPRFSFIIIDWFSSINVLNYCIYLDCVSIFKVLHACICLTDNFDLVSNSIFMSGIISRHMLPIFIEHSAKYLFNIGHFACMHDDR